MCAGSLRPILGYMVEPHAEPRLCRLQEACGQTEVCPREGCAFWQISPSGYGGCALERIDLSGRRELAGWLLDIRALLTQTRDQEDGADVRQLFYERLNAGRGD